MNYSKIKALQGLGESMWILLRKNLWMWRPPRSINVYIFALAFLFSLADWFGHFSAGAWVFPCFLTLILAQAGGASALDVDLKHDNVLFLECLPIRWWQVWLANWLDQLAVCLLIIPLMCWHRVLTWAPPDLSDPVHHFRGDAEFAMFQSRWLLPAGLAAGTFFAYSYALLWRTFFKSHKAALLPTYFGGFLYIMLPLAMPALLMVAPGLWDLWPLLVMQGFVFSICSLIVFAGPPHHWSRGRKFVIVGAPLLLIALMIELSAVWYTCKRCETLDWSEPELAYDVLPRAAGDKQWLSADVRSARSGTHQFIIDPADGSSVSVGRNLEFGTVDSPASGEPLVLLPQRRGSDWLPIHSPIFSMLPDGSGKTTLLDDNFILDEHGNRLDVADAHWVGHATRLAVVAQDRHDRHRILFIRDKNGRTVRRFELAEDYSTFLTDGANLLLTTVLVDAPTHDAEDERVLYRLYDIAANTDSTFELPGPAVCFSEDLTHVVCIRSRIKDNIVHDSLLIVDPATRASRILVDEGVLPGLPTDGHAVLNRFHYPLPRRSGLSGTASDEPLMVFDRAFHRAVLAVDRYEGASVFTSLLYVNLQGGATHTLVSEAQLGSRGVSSSRQGFDLLGFTPDGLVCIYRSQAKLVRVTIADGHTQITQLPADFQRVKISPGGRRVLVHTVDHHPATPRSNWQILDLPSSSPVGAIVDAGIVQWLDDHRLIVTREHGVSLVNADGKNERQLLPPPQEVAPANN